MSRYPLSLPAQLKLEAEALAAQQGISFNQFVLWAVAEKVGALSQKLDDPAFPRITYRRGGSGTPSAVLRGSNIRVKTVAAASKYWGWSAEQFAEQYDIGVPQVREALAFYAAHPAEIDAAIAAEAAEEQAAEASRG